ncbi:DUF6454 family protein [Steroidobacter flavus]|uniref:DUF6454 family protein n=1 Tax=Steroidobacter flavus TaxID=1842136 RepID=A0ABV8SUV2_9GAMM
MKFAPVLALGLALTGYMAASLAGDSEHDRGYSKNRDNKTTTLFRLMGKNTIWTPVKSVTVNWQTFHTQGLVKIGDTFYVSAVEVLEGTVRNGTSTDSLYDFSIDRSSGNGRGWLFKFNEAGELLGKVELTDGSKYHPGGIDFDGTYIWVPVAEYRPNSKSNIFRVDPKTLKAEKIFSEADHIGGIVHNTHDDTLHGVSWGSRRLYTWELSKRGKVHSSDWVPNPQFYIDYQDCHYQGVAYMLCGGVQTYSSPKGNVALGGLELLDLRRHRLEHQLPVNLFIDEGAGPTGTLALTHNAFWLEPLGNGSMRGYFMTETDNQAELVIYDATPWINRE